jgi:hypothetical protein
MLGFLARITVAAASAGMFEVGTPCAPPGLCEGRQGKSADNSAVTQRTEP